ncbi:flagellar biosynthesis protein FlgA [Nonomuraea fuscirosea]|uniref:flagellar biosynthesis protein FlgA n=1 Tax=Nonomuraea fuscirosea TaxID=1291556 RepID=UPI002DD7D4B5|nr:flagellar biosynthesis protein FlgA [Nonomuraea fuscirosea]WSA52716.1 flagellar biosynthesis protein FlgA [Nonomuraea fuscirosea]
MIRSWPARYGRRRRLVAAAFAALSVLAAFLATRPAASAPTVLVAARDLAAGPLDPADFHPAALVPPPAGAVRTISPSASQTLTAPMRRGEPLTDARLLSSYRLPPGLVATPVRISDPAAAALLSPGSTITLLASYAEGVPARQIAPDSQVLTIPGASSPSLSSSNGSLIVLATTITQAAELATAQAHARLSIAIKPNPG